MIKKYALKTSPSESSFNIDYASELNPSQLEVVTTADGPSLVLAGAGSGKTRTLIYRVAYLIDKGVAPEEILLVTFTNKAANEMKSRVEALIKTQAKGLWCGTFHHIGNRTLRMYGSHINLPSDFGILDDEDSREIVKNCMKLFESRSREAKFPKPGVIQSVISFSSNAKKTVPQVVLQHYPHLSPFVSDLEKIKIAYEDKKRRTNNLDYDDLLLRWIELLDKAPAIREKLSRQFRYCLVDEYQDTNKLQHEVIRILSSHHNNLLVVGDDAQSIYSFRAADIKNILDFPESHPNSKVFKLETNYRSTFPILDLANKSISHNVHQFPKTLKSVKKDGSLPQFVKVRDARQEAAFIGQRILEFREQGIELSQMAVLFRAHYQAAELEMELTRRGVPYLVRGGIRFFEQAHIKDILAFLKIIVNPPDELAWARALTLQPGIGASYAEKIFALSQKAGGDLHKVASLEFGSELPPRVRDGLASFKKILRGLLREGVEAHPDMMIEEVLDKGYNKHVLMNFDNAQDRLEDLREFVNFAHTYKNVRDFLADVTLKDGFKGETLVEGTRPAADFDQLVLSTIHQAKGLEWKVVFVIGLSEGLFPHARSMSNEDSLEEERRLFYVATTRAQEDLVLTHPMTRFDYQAGMIINRPSVFVAELPSATYDELEIEESPEEKTIYLDNE